MTDFTGQIIYLCSWLIVPLMLEILPEIYGAIRLLFERKKSLHIRLPAKSLSFISVIVPVFNSAITLKACLRSIYKSKYPPELMEIFVVNNKSTDNSEQIFWECKSEFRTLNMVWLNSGAGKSNALNRALYEANGKYIISIDSDGILHHKAIPNMVDDFEKYKNIHCLSGVILINSDSVQKTPSILQKLEFFEYCQTFLAGRNLASKRGQLYTSAGAFSGFRRSSLFSIGVYNTRTVCEDTDITFAIREKFPDGIRLCEDAYFFTEPTQDINSLYTQRKRWQKGELEIAYLYLSKSLKNPNMFWKDFKVRLLFFDHTFAFTRMVLGGVMVGMLFVDYSAGAILISSCILYLLYAAVNVWYYILALEFLRHLKWYRNIYTKMLAYAFIMPFYSIMLFWMRVTGFFMQTFKGEFWKGETLSEEFAKIKNIIRSDFKSLKSVISKFKLQINHKNSKNN